jgi:hypothetical protein
MKKYFTTIICLIFYCSLHSSDGCFVTLKGLESANDFIIICELQSIAEKSIDEYTIELRISNQLKGKFDNETIQILLGKPLPLNLESKIGNTRFLIFFRELENPSAEKNYTDGCGIIQLNEFNNAVVVRTKEIIEINRIKNERRKIHRLVNWSIDCLKDSSTIHNGLQELSSSGFLYTYDEETESRNQIFDIKRKHKKKLAKYFLNKEYLEYNDVFILDLIEKGNQNVILLKLAEQLNLYETSRYPWYREYHLMKEIARLSKNMKLQQILSKIDMMSFLSEKEDIKKYTIQFITTVNTK